MGRNLLGFDHMLGNQFPEPAHFDDLISRLQ